VEKSDVDPQGLARQHCDRRITQRCNRCYANDDRPFDFMPQHADVACGGVRGRRDRHGFFRQRGITLLGLRSAAPEGVLYIIVIGAALCAISGSESLHGFRLFYVLFVPVVIAAVRHGLDRACFSLAVTQFGLIGLLHLSGYDAAEFTKFQAQMLVLTVTGLIVGVVVTERENSDRLARDAQARLMEKQASAAHDARLNLVSGMASALAHEITQPMTAARALARSAQHILRVPGGDLTRVENNLTTLLAISCVGVVRM
jgi:two-component system, LuxR family, sensor kinase FixL